MIEVTDATEVTEIEIETETETETESTDLKEFPEVQKPVFLSYHQGPISKPRPASGVSPLLAC